MRACFIITILLINTFTALSSLRQNAVLSTNAIQIDNHRLLKVSKDSLRDHELPSLTPLRDNMPCERLLQAYTNEKLQLAAHKDIIRHYIENAWNQGNMLSVDEFVSESYAACGPSAEKLAERDCLKIGIMAFRSAFPDGRFTINDMIAEGDKVVSVQSFQGTHLGEFNGIPATENRVSWTGIFIYRIQDGKIIERWSEIDTLKFMMQIGTISPGD